MQTVVKTVDMDEEYGGILQVGRLDNSVQRTASQPSSQVIGHFRVVSVRELLKPQPRCAVGLLDCGVIVKMLILIET